MLVYGHQGRDGEEETFRERLELQLVDWFLPKSPGALV